MQIEYNNSKDLMLNIKHLMLNMDIKQKDIAEASGLSIQTISNWLACRRDTMTLESLNTIIKAMDCKLYIDIVPNNSADTSD